LQASGKFNLINLISEQYDNLRKIQKFFKANHQLASPSTTTITNLIQTTFLLPRKLARRYGVTVFLCHHRFDVNKRRLRDFNFATFYYFGKCMIKHWTGLAEQPVAEPLVIPPPNIESSPLSSNGSGSFIMLPTTNSLLNINLSFYVLRDMKSVLYSNKGRLNEYTLLVMKAMSKDLRQDRLVRLEERFPSLLKNLLAIGAGLVQPRELRDFFVDVLEKFVDVVRTVPLNGDELQLFCDALPTCFQEMTLKTNQRNKFTSTWSAFLAVVRDVSVLFIKFA
jgi:hypothetical protein